MRLAFGHGRNDVIVVCYGTLSPQTVRGTESELDNDKPVVIEAGGEVGINQRFAYLFEMYLRFFAVFVFYGNGSI